MAAKKKESTIRDEVMRYLNSQRDVWVFKVAGSAFQRRGVPDIVGCVLGLFFAIELKTTTGKQEPSQIVEERKIRAAGGVSVVCRSVEEVRAIIMALRMKVKMKIVLPAL